MSCNLGSLALCLRDVDSAVDGLGVFFARFMDDWVVLARSRWVLRRAVRRIRRAVAGLGLELAPDKTFVGRVGRGFDFLGYVFDGERVGVSDRAVGRFVERVSRLYEQGASVGRIGEYAGRWCRWVRAGLDFEVSWVGGWLWGVGVDKISAETLIRSFGDVE